MIDAGWIFPDKTEYPCGMNYLETHCEMLSYFIRGLRFQNLKLKKQIEDEYWDKWYFKYGSRDLYKKYAVRRLGWIYVESSFSNYIICAGYDWQKDILSAYEGLGYVVYNEYTSPSNFLNVNYNAILAIQNGYRRWNASGEFRYDGTDVGDYYTDENGILHQVLNDSE